MKFYLKLRRSNGFTERHEFRCPMDRSRFVAEKQLEDPDLEVDEWEDIVEDEDSTLVRRMDEWLGAKDERPE